MNFQDYLNRQQSEDRRAFIIHYPAKSGKTRFAERVRQTRADVLLLDLQEYYVGHLDLPPIDEFDFPALRRLLLSLKAPEPVIIVDNADFLFNTWHAAEKQNLLNWLRVGLRSPGDTTKTLVFIVQEDGVLATATFHNSLGEPRVLALNEFEAV